VNQPIIVQPRRERNSGDHGDLGVSMDDLPRAQMQVVDWRPYQKNTLQAYFALLLPSGITIRDFLYDVRGDSQWIDWPSKPYTNKSGETSYIPIIDFADDETKRRFQAEALDAVERHLGGDR
jgi:hypothetical protein